MAQSNPHGLSLLPPCLHAREGVKARQVLIDFSQEQGQGPFTGEALALIKTKIDKALEECEDSQCVHKARVMTRLQNRGVLMELDSDDAVTWFTDTEIRKCFLQKLHPTVFIKSCSCNMVVQFIPLTLKMDRTSDHREVEEVNGFDKGDVTKVRWIKPIARRSPSQTCGHLILSFSCPIPANSMLSYGLVLCHKKVYAEKCKKEPLQCPKCHRWGHLAVECTAEHDTCGTCSQRHCTANCTV